MKFHIHYFKELSSTNTVAFEYAEKGAAEGTVIVTDYQTHGRGKPGRKWLSPAGKNLLFSLLLKPRIPINRAPLLTQLAARSVAKILKNNYNVASRFKRPNDILVKSKKICGILVEACSKAQNTESVVIGVGLNVNTQTHELLPSATSMGTILAKEVNRKKLLKEILLQFKSDLGASGL